MQQNSWTREGDPPFRSGEITIGRYAARWLEGLSSRLRPKTVKSYNDLYRLHIDPALGSVKVGELQRSQVKRLLMAKSGLGLSRNTVRLIGACLSAMYSEAIDDGLISASPAVALGRWVGGRGDGSSLDGHRKGLRPLSEGELAQSLSAAEKLSPSCYPLFLTLARTGCRPGEALALRWSDLNFATREILIERGFSAGQLGPTKTGKIRRVDMSQELACVLRRLQVERENERLRRAWPEMPEWLFVGRCGRPIDEDTPRKVFARVMKRAHLPKHTLYDLRHTFATLHLAKGHPITYVSAQLGHSNPATTLKWYAHWLPSHDRCFADSLDTAHPDLRAG